ncbi:MAG: PAS domain S-box protein, partial [Anaerolineae bacterium]|nr:PAS domain S-box protein [Anaerolineae bacterium]
MRKLSHIILISGVTLLLNVIFWVGESLFTIWYLRTHSSLISPVLHPWTDWLLPQTSYVLFVRLAFFFLSLIAMALSVIYTRRLNGATEALQESEEKYHLVFESVPVGICVSTLEGDFITFNHALREILHSPPDHPLKFKNTREVYQNSADRTKLLQQLQAQHPVSDFAVVLRRVDGTTFTANLTVMRATLAGKSVLLTVMQDVSEQIQARNTLLAERMAMARKIEDRTAQLLETNAELVQAARLRDEFLTNMTHELRTPLTLVLTLTEMLQQELYGPLGSRQREILVNITESGQHLLSLITDILDVSKIEAGKLKLNITVFFIASVCQASLQFVKSQARKRDIAIFSTLPQDNVTMQGDEQRIKQILVNLLSNAIKFTANEGQVGLDVHVEEDDGVVRFSVWDTGIGIAPEDMGRLFEPFMQVDGSSTRQFEGTGLGLALVARLTRMHGGFVSLESRVNKGSRFTISLPLQRPDESVGSDHEWDMNN